MEGTSVVYTEWKCSDKVGSLFGASCHCHATTPEARPADPRSRGGEMNSIGKSSVSCVTLEDSGLKFPVCLTTPLVDIPWDYRTVGLPPMFAAAITDPTLKVDAINTT